MASFHSHPNMAPDLVQLIKKYELDKFLDKFTNDGITSHRHIKNIAKDRLRSHYNMLEASISNFEDLRSECIKICDQNIQIEFPMIVPHNPVFASPPTSITSPPESFGPRSIDNSSFGVAGDLAQPLQLYEGSVICDYDSNFSIGEVKLKDGTPHISMFVCPKTAPDMNKIPRYDLTPVNGSKGLGLVIVNENFDDESLSRKGAKKDFKMLKDIFGKMDLRIQSLLDYNREDCLKSIKSDIDRAIIDKIANIIFIAISSHGEYGDKFLCRDGMRIQIQEIIEILQIPKLNGIPKVLIIQACRGEKHDPAVETDNISRILKTNSISTKESDILVAYSSVPGYVANRDGDKGSWYIESLLRAYNEVHEHSDFLQVLTYTNFLMLSEKEREKDGVICKQPAQFDSTLKKLIFI